MTSPSEATRLPQAEQADFDLLSSDIADLLEYAITGVHGQQLQDFQVIRDAVHHRPGADISVGYRVRYRPRGAGAGAAAIEEYLVATTATLDDHPGVAVLASADQTLRIWRHPGDPRLTGLAAACDADRVAAWLEVADRPSLRIRAYRPLRRAVVEYEVAHLHAFAKVVPPRRAKRLVARHRALADAGIGARVLGTPEPGVLLLAAAEGEPLSRAIGSGDPRQLPSAGDLVALLDALPASVMDLPARRSWSDSVATHALSAEARLPERVDEIRQLERELGELLADSDPGPVVPVHGDFYEANVFVKAGLPTQLIDLDSLGPGHRVDDLACMLAHVDVLSDLAPERYPEARAICASWASVFARTVDPVSLFARTAAVTLSLIAGAHHDASERLDRAIAWAHRARAGQHRSTRTESERIDA